MCDLPKIYPSLPEYTPLSTNLYMRLSQNLPLPFRIYPLFNKFICAILPEFIPLPPRKYPFFNKFICKALPESTPPFNNYMRHSQNVPLPPKIYPPFQQLQVLLAQFSRYVHKSGLKPDSFHFQQIYMYDPPRIYPFLREHAPFQQLCATLPESTHPSQNIPPFLTTIILCDPPRIHLHLPEYF